MEASFLTYFILWAILGVVFYFLGKRAPDTKAKRKIDSLAIVSISILMYAFIFMESGIKSWPIGIFFVLIMFIFLFLSKRYISYYEKFNKRIQYLGENINYCPKCGEGLNK